ncbi:response regulator transcription factor [Mucilaginibacter roseus]|uniref:Response regulator transcription factor n=1 Tax=Mucilaginibacter roseus TaxID=1528868 RepID=A0ABS8TZU8_9SPHI|nr:response regulator transcription factor [Mucilaginibacter roseus]MCD8739350.1 response regulator transcription factor [Mucilaginibacter roseus]
MTVFLLPKLKLISNMLTCIIIDDEEHAIELLRLHIEQTPFLELLYTTTSPVKGLEFALREKVDLVLLDVQMPGITGIEFIKLLKGKCKVILTTAYKEYALDGFDNEVVDYLLKPILYPRFLQAANRALAVCGRNVNPINDYLLVKTELKGKMIKIDIDDIIYIEGLKQYVSIYTQQEQRKIALLNIKDLDQRLPKNQFLRVHKSFIVSVRHIAMIQGNMVYLTTKESIPIGHTYKEAFTAFMKDKIMS